MILVTPQPLSLLPCDLDQFEHSQVKSTAVMSVKIYCCGLVYVILDLLVDIAVRQDVSPS